MGGRDGFWFLSPPKVAITALLNVDHSAGSELIVNSIEVDELRLYVLTVTSRGDQRADIMIDRV